MQEWDCRMSTQSSICNLLNKVIGTVARYDVRVSTWCLMSADSLCDWDCRTSTNLAFEICLVTVQLGL